MNHILTTLLPIGLAVIMFSLGLGLVPNDFMRVAKRPLAFTIGMVNQMLLLPLVAFVIAGNSGLPGDLAFGIMILAFSPGGVTSNLMTKLAKGDVALAVSLTAFTSLAAIVTVPPLVAIFSQYFLAVEAPPINVARLGITMALITAAPVIAGMALRGFFPRLTRAIEPLLSIFSVVLFVAIVGAALYANWDVFMANVPRLGPLLAIIIAVMFAIGYLTARWAGLPTKSASAIAIETGTQNATLGITIGSLIAIGGDPLSNYSLPSGVYGILMYLLVVPFILWRRRAEP